MPLSEDRASVNISLVECAAAAIPRGTAGRRRGMAENIEHRGYTVALLRGQGGWRLYIRPPTAAMTRAELPPTLSREEAITEAKRLVDDAIAAARARR
jgi:hypothetical protein